MNSNNLKMIIDSKSVNERFARAAVCAFLSCADPTVEEIGDIKTAVSEAVTNAVIHGYKNGSGNIYINVKLFDDGRAVIKIRDKGCGIVDIKKAMTPMYTSLPNTERAGLGFALMETFADKVRVRSKVGAGTSVTLYKKLSTQSDVG